MSRTSTIPPTGPAAVRAIEYGRPATGRLGEFPAENAAVERARRGRVGGHEILPDESSFPEAGRPDVVAVVPLLAHAAISGQGKSSGKRTRQRHILHLSIGGSRAPMTAGQDDCFFIAATSSFEPEPHFVTV